MPLSVRGIDVLVCPGYTAGEILPKQGESANKRQQRVIDYIASSSRSKLLFGYTTALDPYLALGTPRSAQVIGAWIGSCVLGTAHKLLEKGVPISMNPSLILTPNECENRRPWSVKAKTDFLLNHFDRTGYQGILIGDWIYYSAGQVCEIKPREGSIVPLPRRPEV